MAHVTCTCDADSMQTVLRAYNQHTRTLMEEREALLQQEKEALDEADTDDEDAVEIADKPVLPKLFNLGMLTSAFVFSLRTSLIHNKLLTKLYTFRSNGRSGRRI